MVNKLTNVFLLLVVAAANHMAIHSLAQTSALNWHQPEVGEELKEKIKSRS
ncbi:MAG: hypothetical protein KH452_10085 [Clostridiales bacterium]|nr:hypothetical protein [Clostridiales bacterium]